MKKSSLAAAVGIWMITASAFAQNPPTVAPPQEPVSRSKPEFLSDRKVKILLRGYQDVQDNNPAEDHQQYDARLRFENNATMGEMYFEANVETRYDGRYSDGKFYKDTDFYLREAYLSWRRPNFEISAGNQTNTWGKLDTVALLDIFTPQDYTHFILYDKQERKIPEVMLKYNHRFDWLSLDAIWMPRFRPDTVRFFNDDWAVFGKLKELVNNPLVNTIATENREALLDQSLKNSQVALRLKSKIKDIDVGLYYMYINSRIPALREKTATGNLAKQFLFYPNAANLAALAAAAPTQADLTLIEAHPRMNVAGLDFETVLGAFGVRGELGYFSDMPYLRSDFSYVEKNTLSTGFGIDHTTAGNFYCNLQIISNTVLNYEDLFNQAQNDWRMTARFRQEFFRGKLFFNFDSSYSFSYHDWMLNPEVSYKFKNGLSLALGGFVFQGKPTTTLGRYFNKDLIYLECTYQF